MEKGNSFRETPTHPAMRSWVLSPLPMPPQPSPLLPHPGQQERLTRTGGGSAEPFLNASDPPGQLHILWEESNAAGMQGEEIGILEEMN